MKISKPLNKKYLSIFIFFFIFFATKINSTEPVDIWNVDPNKVEADNELDDTDSKKKIKTESIYKKNLEAINEQPIQEDETLQSTKIEIAGIYDPEENGLSIDMWTNSDGRKIISLYDRLKKVNLSNGAKEIINISFLTNSYFPDKNISNEQFLKIKSDWLIRNGNYQTIEDYLIKNGNLKYNNKLIKFLVDEYLSQSELEKSCNLFSKLNKDIGYITDDDYLLKFHIYCLINSNDKDQAQLQLDLKKELGFKDDFFEKKFNYLMQYETKIDEEISEKTILDFHLSHRTNPNFKFQPNQSTSKKIWSYLSTSNLLDDIKNIDLEDQNKTRLIEKATHERNYSEKDLYDLYKRFQFSINQLLSVKQSYKVLSSVEARALIYQGILITNETEPRLELVKILKDLFINEGIGNAFKDEMSRILKEINVDEIPANYRSFYDTYVNEEKVELTKIKINNKVIHQSKLINHFRENISKKNIEKDLQEILKKIKKDKKYFVSTKDIILIESLKSDDIKYPKKYSNLYEVDESNMPSDIQDLIDNDEKGLVLLRLAEVIGQDTLENIGPETLYFIISALNQLNIDPLRNRILLKVLPLKV